MKIEKVEELAVNLHDQTEHIIYIRKSKQALNLGFVFKKVHWVFNFNKNAWLKSYMDINTDLGK